MSFEFREPPVDPQQQALRERMQRFVAEVVEPHAPQWEADGMIPRAVYRQLGELGLIGLSHPLAHGGSAMGAMASAMLGEEMARSGYGGFATSVIVHADMTFGYIARHGSAAQQARYLSPACRGESIGAICVTEPQAGSDVAALAMLAQPAGEGWRLDGIKTYVTNGVQADVYIVAAKTDPQAKGSRGISLFIVERGTPGLTVSRRFDKHGWRCSDTAELRFDNVRLAADALIGEAGKGFYYVMGTFQMERLVTSAMAVGLAAKAIDVSTEYLRQRPAFGKPLWEQPVVRSKIAWLAAKAAAARAMVYQCVHMIEAKQDCVREVSMLKAYACETLQEVVHGCLQLTGGIGYITGTPIERMVRDARVMTIAGGATEVMLEEIAKRL